MSCSATRPHADHFWHIRDTLITLNVPLKCSQPYFTTILENIWTILKESGFLLYCTWWEIEAFGCTSFVATYRARMVKNRYDKKHIKILACCLHVPFLCLPLQLSLWVLACPLSFLFFLTDDWILFTLLTGVIWACQGSDINQLGLDWISQRPPPHNKKTKQNKYSSKNRPFTS